MAHLMTNKQLTIDNIDCVENLHYTPLERKYLKVLYVKTLFVYLAFMVLALFLLLADTFNYRYLTVVGMEGVLLIALIANLFLLPKAFAYKGFAIREHDVTYRSGLFFPSVTTIPFCKIQQVSVRNGAQLLANTSIPGLAEEKANEIKVLIIESIRNEGK